jgi:hypothetical protein
VTARRTTQAGFEDPGTRPGSAGSRLEAVEAEHLRGESAWISPLGHPSVQLGLPRQRPDHRASSSRTAASPKAASLCCWRTRRRWHGEVGSWAAARSTSLRPLGGSRARPGCAATRPRANVGRSARTGTPAGRPPARQGSTTAGHHQREGWLAPRRGWPGERRGPAPWPGFRWRWAAGRDDGGASWRCRASQ